LEIADDEFVHSSSPCARRGMASARSGSVASRRPLALWRCLYMNVVRRGFSTTRPAAAPRAPPTASPPAGIAADGRTRRAQRSRGAACAPLALDPARLADRDAGLEEAPQLRERPTHLVGDGLG